MRMHGAEQRTVHNEALENAYMRSRYNGMLRLLDDVLAADGYQSFVDNAARTVSSLFDANLATIYLLSPDRSEFLEQTNVARLFSTESVDYARLPTDVGDISQLFVGRQLLPMNFGQPRRGSEYDVAVGEAHVSALCVPLYVDVEAFGFYALIYNREVSWTKRDLDYLLAVGHLLGIVIRRVYSGTAFAAQAGDLRECRMLSREIRRELEAILAQTKAEKPEAIAGFTEPGPEVASRPITPGDSFRPTRREAQLMAYAAEGYTNKEIAAELFISESSVKKMFVRLVRNSGLRNRAHIAAYAVRHGFTID